MRLRALAKINLGLDVVGKRDDGYHEGRMIMQTIQMYDVLEIEKKKEPGIVLTTNIPYVPTDERNLVYKAAKMLMDEFDIKEGLTMNLEKFIPVAAGMAGGSSDAAAAFVGVNRLFGLGLSEANSSALACGFNPMYRDKITKKYTRNNSGFTFFVLYPTPPHRYFCRMELFDAIRRMRELSRKNETFSFSFMSYNSSAGRSEGIVEVRHARLRARAQDTHHRHAEIIEEYIDIDTGRARHFYQPLLMSFNGEKVYA